jgi:hypothetical protein
MEINKMSKEDLIKLKTKVNDQLKRIKANSNAKIESNTILSLKKGDNIFGIRLSFGGHTLEEPKELIGKVDIADYCIVNNMNAVNDGEGERYRLGISHPTACFGTVCTVYKEDYKNGEYCMLHVDTMKRGYDSFYTLKPESWKEDLKRKFEWRMKLEKENHLRNLEIYQTKLNMFLKGEEKINKKLKTG